MNVNEKSLVGEGVASIRPICMPPNRSGFGVQFLFVCLCVPSVLAGLVKGINLLENGKEKLEKCLQHGTSVMTPLTGNWKILLPSFNS